MSTESHQGTWMLTFMQYLKHPDTGVRAVCKKIKSHKALEKKSIKEWAYAIHDKDPLVQPRVRSLLQ